MKKKLDTSYVLTIREEYHSLIPLVASMNGWNGEGEAKDHLSNITNEIIKSTMRNMIESALRRYYGHSQENLIDAAMTAYDESATLESTWSEVE